MLHFSLLEHLMDGLYLKILVQTYDSIRSDQEIV